MNTKLTPAELGRMTLGSAMVAVGVYFFKFPNHFSMGGVSGLSILLGQLIPSDLLTPGAINMGINVIYLILGFLILNKGFGVRTVYCSLLYSALVQGLEWICPLTRPLTDQKMLELFFAVILPALGSAILFNTNASTGGTDIMAMILKKFTGLDVGRALLVSDVAIAGAALVIFNIETGLFSLLGLALKSVLVDSVIESLNRKKAFTVVTQDPEKVCHFINESMARGATVWKGQGAYTGQDQYIVLAALSRHQAVVLRNFLRAEDPHAFMVITNSSEIFGKGFLRA
ncbi:YitT family protein [Candidatus Pseudoscillospira sp. SGI.172]|uniref:YitT family protein n=1 Tax=Candidatus Pseudoscillospira sp. SGI.172 TaxID=3420582 RepID=UPI0009B94ED1|nr:YitT family protein [Pseudoflavonifractor sp.]MDY3019949.1 YitT family protein [Oscillospiraceae bacterium]